MTARSLPSCVGSKYSCYCFDIIEHIVSLLLGSFCHAEEDGVLDLDMGDPLKNLHMQQEGTVTHLSHVFECTGLIGSNTTCLTRGVYSRHNSIEQVAVKGDVEESHSVSRRIVISLQDTFNLAEYSYLKAFENL